MPELKTLKDFEEHTCGGYAYFAKGQLRQEAIKEIKLIEKSKLIHQLTQIAGEDIIVIEFSDGTFKKVTTEKALKLRQLSDYKSGNVGEYIKWKFNITEKELK